MAARLKVFVTSDGLTDFVVATTSKPKALAAWGSHQDLFKTGLAHETDDPALVKAATAQPDEVLRRPAGAKAALAKLKTAKRAKPGGPSKAALKKVSDLEAKLTARDEAHERELKALELRRAAIDREIADEAADYARDRSALEARLRAAKQALRS